MPITATGRFARAVVLGLVVMAITLGVATPQASAAIGTMQAKLTITRYKAGYSNVAVFGHVPATQGEARALLNGGAKVVMRMWGDDPVSDDLLFGPYDATEFVPASPDFQPMGLHFHKVLIGVPNSKLDEDTGGYDTEGDELYVGVRLLSRSGGTIRSRETNRENRSFSF